VSVLLLFVQGPALVRRVRPDLRVKFEAMAADPDAVFDYIYHCNVQLSEVGLLIFSV